MLLLDLDRESDIPIYKQIVDRIIELIETDVLHDDSVLPATRNFAKSHGIDRTTVCKAYRELWSMGFIESTPGSYTRVRKRSKLSTPQTSVQPSLIDWDKAVSSHVARSSGFHNLTILSVPQTEISFALLTIDKRLYPIDQLRRSFDDVLFSRGDEALNYGDVRGYKPLREWIAEQLSVHSIRISADDIIITNGSTQGMELIMHVLGGDGKTVIIESPTYSNIIPLIRLFGNRIAAVPMKPDGMDTDVLEQLIIAEKPAFVYTIPTFHNPTGITTSQQHRERVMDICNRHRIPVIEDGFVEDMKYFGKVVLPIKSMDTGNIVVFLGTLSKIAFPGLRLGWVAAHHDCIEKIASVKRSCDLSGNMLVQMAADDFCRKGKYDAHVRKMHHIFASRMRVMQAALRRECNFPFVTWQEPNGGYLIWLELHDAPGTAADLRTILNANGTDAITGDIFFPGTPPGVFMRLSISTVNEAEIDEGVKRIGRSLRDWYERRQYDQKDLDPGK